MACSTPGLPVHHQLPELKLMSIESVMPSSHLILCRPFLLPPSIIPSIRVFSDESVIHTRVPNPEPPSHLSPHILSLGHPSAPAPSILYPVSCIEPRLAIHFLHDSIHVSMPFSQIIPCFPSPSESKSPLYTSVSLLLSHIQGHHYHLSEFHIYVLVYCIGVFLSGLLHSV